LASFLCVPNNTRQFAAQGQVECSAATRFSAGDHFQSRGGTAAGMIALSMLRFFPAAF
jgi:hypothetical protein